VYKFEIGSEFQARLHYKSNVAHSQRTRLLPRLLDIEIKLHLILSCNF